MTFSLLSDSMIAATPTSEIKMMKAVIAMSVIQSSAPTIEKAATQQTFLFVGYVVLLVLTAVITVLLYRAGNKYQEAVKRDADARIEEAKRGALEAHAQAENAKKDAANALKDAAIANESAGKANESAQRLEQQNIQLRTDLESATAESREKQAELTREQSRLAHEQRKTAEAQKEAATAQLALKKHLEEVAERQRPRHLTEEQTKRLIALLAKVSPKGDIIIECFDSVSDSCEFAVDFRTAFLAADFPVRFRQTGQSTRLPPTGLFLAVSSLEEAPSYATPLGEALKSIGLGVTGLIGANNQAVSALVQPQTVVFVVGARP